MRWLLGLLILLPQPLVMFMFVAGGADGKRESAVKWAVVTAVIFSSAVYSIYRLVRADRLLWFDWIAILVSLSPIWVVAIQVVRMRHFGS